MAQHRRTSAPLVHVLDHRVQSCRACRGSLPPQKDAAQVQASRRGHADDPRQGHSSQASRPVSAGSGLEAGRAPRTSSGFFCQYSEGFRGGHAHSASGWRDFDHGVAPRCGFPPGVVPAPRRPCAHSRDNAACRPAAHAPVPRRDHRARGRVRGNHDVAFQPRDPGQGLRTQRGSPCEASSRSDSVCRNGGQLSAYTSLRQSFACRNASQLVPPGGARVGTAASDSGLRGPHRRRHGFTPATGAIFGLINWGSLRSLAPRGVSHRGRARNTGRRDALQFGHAPAWSDCSCDRTMARTSSGLNRARGYGRDLRPACGVAPSTDVALRRSQQQGADAQVPTYQCCRGRAAAWPDRSSRVGGAVGGGRVAATRSSTRRLQGQQRR